QRGQTAGYGVEHTPLPLQDDGRGQLSGGRVVRSGIDVQRQRAARTLACRLQVDELLALGSDRKVQIDVLLEPGIETRLDVARAGTLSFGGPSCPGSAAESRVADRRDRMSSRCLRARASEAAVRGRHRR